MNSVCSKLFCIAIFCIAIVVPSESQQPVSASVSKVELVKFRINGVDNFWHLAFSPDSRTAYYLVDSFGMETLCYSRYKNNSWGKSVMLPFAGKYRIETPSLSPDGNRLYFTLPVMIDTVNRYDRAILHVSKKKGNAWTEPEEMSNQLNFSQFQNCPRETVYGNLYFCAFWDGGLYLFKSLINNGVFDTPVRLISSAGYFNTADFAIAPDESYLIFEHFNNFYVSFNMDNQWSLPVSMGNEINSPDLEVRPLISPDGNFLYFKRLNPENYLGDYFQVNIRPVIETLKVKLISKEIGENSVESVPISNCMVSSCERNEFSPLNIFDGNPGTRWSSEFSDPQWLIMDLGTVRQIAGIDILWEAFAKSYSIETSDDSKNWYEVYNTAYSTGGLEHIDFKSGNARFIRINGINRGTPYGYSIAEIKVFTANK